MAHPPAARKASAGSRAVTPDAPEDPVEDAATATPGDPASRYRVACAAEALRAMLSALFPKGAGEEVELEAWARASLHWSGTLTRSQRRMLLEAAISACAVDDAVEILDAELARLTESPGPALTTVREEARVWAYFSAAPVLKIYLVAIFRALPRKDRIAALPALQRFALK